jgi:hypothetical protein
MALITTYHDPIAISRTRADDDYIIEAQKNAHDIAMNYGVPSVKYTDKLGLCYLTWARRTKAGVSTTYTSEAALLNAYHKSLEA